MPDIISGDHDPVTRHAVLRTDPPCVTHIAGNRIDSPSPASANERGGAIDIHVGSQAKSRHAIENRAVHKRDSGRGFIWHADRPSAIKQAQCGRIQFHDLPIDDICARRLR